MSSGSVKRARRNARYEMVTLYPASGTGEPALAVLVDGEIDASTIRTIGDARTHAEELVARDREQYQGYYDFIVAAIAEAEEEMRLRANPGGGVPTVTAKEPE